MCEARSTEVHEQQRVSNSVEKSLRISSFSDETCYFFNCLTWQKKKKTPLVYLFSSSYVTQKWTYLGDLQKSKLTGIESVWNGCDQHCRTETQSSTDSGSSCGCCNWWNTINMLTCGAVSALTHLAIINLSWEQLPTLCKPERETEEKTEHTCKNSVVAIQQVWKKEFPERRNTERCHSAESFWLSENGKNLQEQLEMAWKR